jgi:hypothetical protein
VVVAPFPTTAGADWYHCYTEHRELFAGCRELRFSYPDEHRSLYGQRFDMARKRVVPIVEILPIGSQWSPELTAADGFDIQMLRGKLLVHPFAGQKNRQLPDAFLRAVLEAANGRAVVLGAPGYGRPGHGDESLPDHEVATVSPRALLELVQLAPGVVGSESCVYYAASMVGTPTLMGYTETEAFGQMRRGDRTWDWFFNLNDERSLNVPLSAWDPVVIKSWVERRLAEAL